MKLPKVTFIAGAALTFMTLVGTTGTAHAAAGQLTLISGTDSRAFVYESCQPPRQFQQPLFQLESFRNQPPPGCQAVLVNRAGASKVLCVGHGYVPSEFSRASLVRIQPGTAPACAYEPMTRH
ncbi:hypothetical protein [Nonomuraea diastatica]|uniref:Protease n=1 Tax=Nonomuraea diastatica TaxID=1848329 RepID=A0A4R4WUL2_9ACTN|nr:hypothetical protein [Nonomuraea diastatica]TDD21336.1 hypothetical protein E1294_15255 [Nonomuraea diastatica]